MSSPEEITYQLHERQGEVLLSNANEILYGGAAGGGKALWIETPILTARGFVPMKDVHPGDTVFGENGKPCTVIAETPIMEDRPCYIVEFDNGETICADEEHLWKTLYQGKEGIRTTKEILETLFDSNKKPNHTVCRTADSKTFAILNVCETDSVPVKCIQVSNPSGMYLCGYTLIPTHNSHLMRVMAILCSLYVPGLLTYLFRRYSNDLIQNHFNGPTGFPALLAPFIEAGYCKISYSPNAEIRFWNGAKIMACHCQYEKDVERFRGAEIHLLLIDELTLFPELIYRYLRGRCRASDQLIIPDKLKKAYPGIRFPKIVAGTNPTGPGHNWVKSTFIDPQKPWKVWKTSSSEGGFLRQFIPARLADNPSLNAEEYMATLQGLGPSWLVKAMADGNWDVKAGGAFDDLWNNDTHTMPKFKIPATWYVDRTFDWGTTKPWACLYFAESDGSDVVMPDGTEIPTIRGDIFVIDELYGCSGKADCGTGEVPKEVAEKILARDKELKLDVHDGAADSAIFGDTWGRGHTIAKSFSDNGVYWRHADKSPGSRKNGLVTIRERLKNTLIREHEPGLFVFDHCRNFLRTVPSLQYAQNGDEDVDTTQEDHCLHGDTIVHTLEYGSVPIRDLVGKRGNCLTSGGYYAPFDNCRLILRNRPTIKLETEHFGSVICSADHMILQDNLTFMEAGLWKLKSYRKHNNVSTVKCTTDAGTIFNAKENACILPSGNIIMAQFQKELAYIMRTETDSITPLIIFDFSQTFKNTGNCTAKTGTTEKCRAPQSSNQRNGIGARRENNGIEITMRLSNSDCIRLLTQYALSAERDSKAEKQGQSFVATIIKARTGENPERIMSRKDALSAAKCLSAIATTTQKHAPGFAPGNTSVIKATFAGRSDLYCLNVHQTHVLAVNDGIIVSNCYDCLRYRLSSKFHGEATVEAFM